MNYTQVCSDYARYTVTSQYTYCVHTLVPTQLKNVTLTFQKTVSTVAKLLQNRKRFQKSARSFYSKGGRWKDLPLSRTGLFVAVTVLSFRPTQLILIRLSQPIGIEKTFGRFALSRAFTLNFNFKSGQSVVSSMRTRTYEQANKFEFAYIERARISFRIPSSSKKFIKDTSNDSKLQFSLSGDGSRLPIHYYTPILPQRVY